MNKILGNRGSVDPEAWITGLFGFSITFIAYIAFGPTFLELSEATNNMGLGDVAINNLSLTQMMYDYAMIFNAGAWLVYILYSSIRQEVEERMFQRRYM